MGPYLRRRLPHPLLVSTPHYNPRLTRSFDAYVLRTPILDRVRKSQRQIQHAVLQLSTVSDPYKLQLLLEAIANTRYHIRYE